jgi:transcriptional regulator with XRE-family HTH domain
MRPHPCAPLCVAAWLFRANAVPEDTHLPETTSRFFYLYDNFTLTKIYDVVNIRSTMGGSVASGGNNAQIAGIGERIRARRRELRLTLQQLAKSTGLSIGFISLVERGQTSPSLSSLTNIATALDLPLGALVDAPESPQSDSYQDSRPRFAVENGRIAYERLSTVFAGSCVHAVKMLMPAGYMSETVLHAGEEFVFVLQGEIEYRVDRKLYKLKVGDSVHFDATKPHSVKAVGGEAQVLWVGTLNVYDTARTRASGKKVARFGNTEFHDPVIRFETQSGLEA